MILPEVVRVKSSHPASQGAFVEINKSDFDSAVHTLYTLPDVPPLPILPAVSVPVAPVTPPAIHPALANLPRDWRERKTGFLRDIAEKLSGRTPDDRAQAIAVIEAALPLPAK